MREDWSDAVLAPLERFEYEIAREPLPQWIRETHKPTSGPYRDYGTLPTLIGSYFAGSAETYKGTPERVLAWLHQRADLDSRQREFLTDLLESAHPVELGALLATSSLSLYELVRALHRCEITTGWHARWLNPLAIPDRHATFPARDVTTTAWGWAEAGDERGAQRTPRLGVAQRRKRTHFGLEHRPANRLELGVDRETWNDRIGTGQALPIHDVDDETPGRQALALCRSLHPPPERLVYSKHGDWWRLDAPWGALCLHRAEDGEPAGESTDPDTGLRRESAHAAITRLVEDNGPLLDATDCVDIAEALDRTPEPFDRNRQRPTWCRRAIMLLRARALHAVWDHARNDDAQRYANAAAQMTEWTLDALTHDERPQPTKTAARWKRA